MIDTEQLKELGFEEAAELVQVRQEKAKKLVIAYEHYRYVRQEHIDRFNAKLKNETIKKTGKARYDLREHYDSLVLIPIQKYKEVPPSFVLDSLKEAKTRNCFDTFEIAKIEGVNEYKDPILFGRVNDCPDRFYISQWDDDVKIEDILEANEG